MDDADLRRLAEIGIDVYVPRESPRVAGAAAAQPLARAPAAAASEAPVAGGVVLLAGASGVRGDALLAGVTRALALARIDCVRIDAADEAVLATASALVAFGDARARAAGAALSAQRQREIGWVVTAEADLLAGDARAKRALWSELKRIVRPLLQAPRRAADVSHGDER
ncbi:MAG TPA: hypothetical protein VFS55_16215 [Dokdonella sp.]|nr:hypothetical protein [Dokdonella sp.]